MQRGPLLQPLRSTELVLSGPPRAHPSGCVQPFRLRRAQHRQAHRSSHCLSFVGLILSHLSRSTEEANPPAGRVFLSAFSPKKPHSFPMGKPRFAPLPPRRIRLTPFPQSCHGFVLCRNRASPEVQPISVVGVSLQSRARRKPELGYSQGFSLGPALPFPRTAFPQRRISFGAHGEAVFIVHPSAISILFRLLHCRRLRKNSAAVASSPFRLPCGAWFSNHRKIVASSFSRMLCNSARQMSSEYWNSHYGFFQCLEI